MDRCGLNSNLEILLLSWSPVGLMMIRSKTKSLYRVHIFSIISLWGQGHVTMKRTVHSGLKWNLSKISSYACPRCLQFWRRSDQNWRRYSIHNIFFQAQWQVTRKPMDGYILNSKSFEHLWLSLLLYLQVWWRYDKNWGRCCVISPWGKFSSLKGK